MAKDFSLMDRIIGSGRVWADRLHRGAVYTLIAASGMTSSAAVYGRIAGALTIYSASSLVVYNRRQRALWIDRELQKLFDARKAYVEGNASLEQLELLQREKEADEANARYQEEKKQKYSYKVRQWIFGSAGLKNEEASAEPVEKPYADAGEGKPTLMEAINAKRLEIERGVVPGAPTSTPAAEEQQPQKKSWTSWLTGR
ncbi:hypothetical protein KEM55_003907 [Ascosphaera atra]|nr:hypothetical protein KEM55_003907 [Ascosphaera atra]